MPSGTQPRWVQTPRVISQFCLPGLVRSASVCGSRRLDSGTAFASAISLGIRLRTNTGCLRQLTLIPCPGTTLEMSTSVVASASTSADGDIWTISGTRAATVPTPAKLTAATFRKSRRRTPSPPSLAAAVLSETPADCALVAIIPLLTRMAGACRKARQLSRSGWAPARLAGLIATGSDDVKGPMSPFSPSLGTPPSAILTEAFGHLGEQHAEAVANVVREGECILAEIELRKSRCDALQRSFADFCKLLRMLTPCLSDQQADHRPQRNHLGPEIDDICTLLLFHAGAFRG